MASIVVNLVLRDVKSAGQPLETDHVNGGLEANIGTADSYDRSPLAIILLEPNPELRHGAPLRPSNSSDQAFELAAFWSFDLLSIAVHHPDIPAAQVEQAQSSSYGFTFHLY